ncbi:MAG: hypothetical protein AB1490_12040 [Pseudomonadota bacterium]
MIENVGIKRAVVAGIEVTSFLDPGAPFPDESLLGFYTRVAADHCFRSIPHALQKAGIVTSHPSSLPVSAADAAERLAFSLKQDPAAVLERMYRESTGRPIMIDFFGTGIRKSFREAMHRRVSPSALRVAPYHRAIWEIKLFSFCPDTKELLLERCPVCNLRFGWLRTNGIQYCDSCKKTSKRGSVDLRDVSQPMIGSHDEAGLNFICDLVHPLQQRKDRARRALRPPFAEYSNSQLFEFAIALACAEASDRSGKTLERPKRHDDYSRLTPDILSHAGRAVLDWPAGFHAIAGAVRSKAGARPSFFGLGKELGPLTTIRREASIADRLRQLVSDAIDENMKDTAKLMPTARRREHRNRADLITTSDATSIYGFNRAVLVRLARDKVLQCFRSDGGNRSPSLFVKTEVNALWHAKQLAETETSTAKRLGIPLRYVHDLARLGLIKLMTGPVNNLRGYSRCYTKSSVDALISQVGQRVRKEPLPENADRIDTPVSLGRIGTEAWANIVREILDGNIAVWRVADENAPLLRALAVDERHRVTEIFRRSARSSECGASTIDALTYKEGAKFIDTSVKMIRCLIVARQIPVTDHRNRKLLRSDLQTFKKDKMLTREIASRLTIATSRVPSELLARHGIEPVATVNGRHGHVWSRQEVEPHLEGSNRREGLLADSSIARCAIAEGPSAP